MKYGLDDDGVFRIEAPIQPTSKDATINAPIKNNYQMSNRMDCNIRLRKSIFKNILYYRHMIN